MRLRLCLSWDQSELRAKYNLVRHIELRQESQMHLWDSLKKHEDFSSWIESNRSPKLQKHPD